MVVVKQSRNTPILHLAEGAYICQRSVAFLRCIGTTETPAQFYMKHKSITMDIELEINYVSRS